MSARDNLIEILNNGGPHSAFSNEEVADSILRENARELAEMIRADKTPASQYSRRSSCETWFRQGKNQAADIIDPGVEA